MLTLFHTLIAAHIAVGAVGLVSFWVPVLGKKGSKNHRLWGKVFTYCILAAGGIAVLLSLCTLYDPLGTHPHLKGAEFIRGIFGFMMLYLAILTINLGWYGLQTIANKRDHARNRQGLNLWLQPLLTIAAAVCAYDGWRIGQPLMMGISVIGFATVITNLGFMLNPSPPPKEWLKEHVKALVGAGISVYTAFSAFGAVRFMPEIALHPGLWAVPLTVGLSIILYHHYKIRQGLRRPLAAPATPA